MAQYKYAVSFRLKNATCAGSTYGERLESLMAQIRATGNTWEETTSFALFSSSETIGTLIDRLYFESSFSEAHDLMIVIDIHSGVAMTRGVVSYPSTLRSLVGTLAQK